jgi:hypothetical protein
MKTKEEKISRKDAKTQRKDEEEEKIHHRDTEGTKTDIFYRR